ncbi:unnamed protein product [Menidia menidia]|uniref:(Atlantic silverside) hypothetical protein n=1 Tax=Menidia menidia TaxID=238744 RepID=A0A8S4BDL8_9TELE|nr:unnamed protein product [Menidia menidia]
MLQLESRISSKSRSRHFKGVSMDPACCDSAEAPAALVVQVCFPGARAAVLDNLNRQREEGRLCDLSIQVQGRVFRAHRCVLAASSPYFHDQVLLKDVAAVALPSVLDPLAFESVLRAAYTGRLSVVRDEVVHYVTVASFLQMWHIVDKCTEILKKPRPPPPGPAPRQPSPSSTDSPERGGRRRDRRTHALPPLATWRRPQQPARWGRHRASPAPQDPADSQLDGPPSYQYGCGEAWAAPEGAGPSGGGGEAVKQRARFQQRTGPTETEADEGVGDQEATRRGGLAHPARSAALAPAPSDEEVMKQRAQRGEAGGGGYPGPSGLASARFQWQAGSWTQQDLAAQDTAGAPGWKEEEEEEEDEEEDVFECFSFEADGPEPPWSPRGVQGGCGGVQGGSGGTQGGCGGVQGGCRTPSSSVTQGGCGGAMGSSGGVQGGSGGAQGGCGGVQGGSGGAPGGCGAQGVSGGNQGVSGGNQGGCGGVQGGCGGVQGGCGAHRVSGGTQGVSGGNQGGCGGTQGGSGGSPEGCGAPSSSRQPSPPSCPSPPTPSSSSWASPAPPPGKLHRCHCGKAYALKSMRDRHVKMAHLNLRPFGCPVCSKSFKMKHHLTKHLRTHGGLRPYECSLCGKKVVWRDSFLRHQARCQRLAGAAKATAAPPPQDGYGYGFPQGGAFPPAGQVKVEEVDFHREMGGLLDSVSGMVEDSHSLDAGGHVFKEEASESFGGS